MFQNYEHRGDVFKQLVHQLDVPGGSGAEAAPALPQDE